MSEHDYVNNGLFQELEEISCWHHLKRIVIEHDVFADGK
jgi:hypothetical protein